MRTSKIKAKLRRNEPVLVPAMHINDPAIFELASLFGFDGLWLDMEHQSRSLETAGQLVRAARVGTSDVMVRCAKGEFLRLGRMLEIGATGIMYPRCDNAAEAREVVKWAKFAPLGTRGVDSAGADNPYCTLPLVEYLKAANDETFIVIQIEDQGALDHCEEMAKVPGVDVLFFGPGDYSILSGFPGQWDHPKIMEAMHGSPPPPRARASIGACRPLIRSSRKGSTTSAAASSPTAATNKWSAPAWKTCKASTSRSG